MVVGGEGGLHGGAGYVVNFEGCFLECDEGGDCPGEGGEAAEEGAGFGDIGGEVELWGAVGAAQRAEKGLGEVAGKKRDGGERVKRWHFYSCFMLCAYTYFAVTISNGKV